jgi:hypothetical protein
MSEQRALLKHRQRADQCSELAPMCGVRGTADDGGGLEEPVSPAGNLKMITMSEAVSCGCRSQLAANIATVVSG